MEHKQVVVEDFMGPQDAFRILRESLQFCRKLRRREISWRILGTMAGRLASVG